MSLFGNIGQAATNLFSMPANIVDGYTTAWANYPQQLRLKLALEQQKLAQAQQMAQAGNQFAGAVQGQATPPGIVSGDTGVTAQAPDMSAPITPVGRQLTPTEIAAIGAARGGDLAAAGNLVKPPDPQWAQGSGGSFYNAHSDQQPDSQANRANVNNTIVDLNDASNTNRTIPTLGQGQEFVYGPDGKNAAPIGVRNMDGTIQALRDQTAAVTGTQESIKAGLDLIDVPETGPDGRPTGRTMKVTRSQAVRMAGGGPPPSAPRIGGAAPPPGPPQAGGMVAQSPADATYAGKTAEAAAKQYDDIQTAGAAAPNQIATMQQIGALLGNFQGGWVGQAGHSLVTAANAIPGLHISETSSKAQAGEAVVNQIALQLRSTANGAGMPGSMSNADRDFLVKSVPGLTQSPEGRRQLIQYYSAVQQRSMDVAGFARKWQQRYGRIDAPDPQGKTFQDYLNGWSATNPLFGGQRPPSGPPRLSGASAGGLVN